MIARGKHAYDNFADTCKTIQLYILVILIGIIIAVVPIVGVWVGVKIISFLFYKLSTFTARALFIAGSGWIYYIGYHKCKQMLHSMDK